MAKKKTCLAKFRPQIQISGATMSSRVQQPVQKDFMIDYCSLNVEDQNLKGEAGCDHPLPWKLTSLVTMATKIKSPQN